ncbi:MAG: hypothetical protein SOV27_01980 [Eubacteriales bacterium]|nr:hypothetical protein [Eubacteriales bacterium]
MTNLSLTKDLNLVNIFPKSQVEVFTDSLSGLNYKKVQNGLGEIIFCDVEELNNILKQTDKMVGFTLKIENEEVKSVLKKINAQNTYYKNYGFYGWSKILNEIFKIKNNKVQMFDGVVNFQALQRENDVILGFPIILGSY